MTDYSEYPTPEDVFSGKVNVYLTDGDLSAPVLVVRAIRDLMRALGRPDAKVTDAWPFYERFGDGERPLLIGWADSAEHAREVAAEVRLTSNNSVSIGIGLSDEEIAQMREEHESAGANDAPAVMDPMRPIHLVEAADEREEDWTPSVNACKLALNILAQHQGIALNALAWTKVMAESSDEPIFDEVAALIRASFPMEGR